MTLDMPFLKPAVIAAALLLSACGTIPNNPAGNAKAGDISKFEQDRQAILAMAGNFEVSFDFIETVSFVEGYEPKDRKLSGGDEIVRVVEDRGDFISLQHILVAGGDRKFAIKHWRQDWRFEPSDVLVFVGGNAWENRQLKSRDVQGKWSQVVYQVDDAPRYGALGAWSHANGVSQWTPPSEWRPLPRRDATTREDYHAIDAVNRHTITSTGWVHEQNNSKLILNGEPQNLVREIAINTYRRSDNFDTNVGDSYWNKTKDFWSGVRNRWTKIEQSGSSFGLTIQGEPEELYVEILELADAVNYGNLSTPEAIAKAKAFIDQYTTSDIGTLQARLFPKDDLQRTADAAK